ncbi:MAG: NADH:flavin oxidoreductase/NADH oxidase [Wenzhouxiangellaceae bacterium]
MPHLFSPLTLRGVTLRNRIAVSPMCQYSSVDGLANNWHLVHLGSRAVGGAGLVMSEAAAVTADGRITPSDLGLWNDEQTTSHACLAAFIRQQGAIPAIQLAHAGRKAGHLPPWQGQPKGRQLTADEGAWTPQAPSAIPFQSSDAIVPAALTLADIQTLTEAFASAAKRADQAGYDWLELHAAHGYLLHSFLSSTSNQRDDQYGGSLANRCRLSREVSRAVRAVWPDHKVLAMRISYTDWSDCGWQLQDSLALCNWLKEDGIDLIDASSAGSIPNPDIPAGPGYQVPGAAAIRQHCAIPVAAVGQITEPAQADMLIRNQQADLVMLGREMLRNPYWPATAAISLGQTEQAYLPIQYQRAHGQRFHHQAERLPEQSDSDKA